MSLPDELADVQLSMTPHLRSPSVAKMRIARPYADFRIATLSEHSTVVRAYASRSLRDCQPGRAHRVTAPSMSVYTFRRFVLSFPALYLS